MATDREKLQEAMTLLRGVVAKNKELSSKLEAAPTGGSEELAEARRERDRWRTRAYTLEGVLQPIVGEELPRGQAQLVKRLGEVFINHSKVDPHLQESASQE